jgi:hypothetical protein
MTEVHIKTALATFDKAISAAKTADQAFGGLQALTEAVVGVKLFTVMKVDMAADVSRRAFTSDPASYPTSGTKKINRTFWFDIVHKERRFFIANTLDDISKVFPDYELIGSLGCGSVINMPVIIGNELIGTVNLLHAEQYYTPERVALVAEYLSVPAKLAVLVASRG